MAFSFGTQKAPSFGTTTTAAAPTSAPAFSFGLGGTTTQQSATSATSTAATGFTFPSTSAPGAAPATTSAFSFAPPASTTTAGVTFGTAPTAAPQSSQPSGFSFGTSLGAPAASAPTLGLSSVQPFTGFGLTASSAPSTLAATQPTTSGVGTLSASSFGGLGGVPSSGTTETTPGFGFSGGLTATKVVDARGVKELPVPVEILQVIEDLKNHMKNHKVKMTEMGRASDKNIDRVVEEIEDARLAISNLTNLVHRQGLFCVSLMKDIQEEMKNVDMAMVTRDTPFALQNEITAPTSYFYRLVNNYQERMLIYKREIERAETALSSLVESQGFSSKDLISALQGTRETVMSLAAKVQDLHEQVVSELTTHRNLKRFAVGDGQSDWNNGTQARSASIGGTLTSPLGNDMRRSVTRMDPVIPPNINSNYNRVYDKVNVLFNTPPKISDISSLGYRPGAVISTPVYPRPGFSSPPSLFQTGCSTILGPATPVGGGSGLKRSKR